LRALLLVGVSSGLAAAFLFEPFGVPFGVPFGEAFLGVDLVFFDEAVPSSDALRFLVDFGVDLIGLLSSSSALALVT